MHNIRIMSQSKLANFVHSAANENFLSNVDYKRVRKQDQFCTEIAIIFSNGIEQHVSMVLIDV